VVKNVKKKTFINGMLCLRVPANRGVYGWLKLQRGECRKAQGYCRGAHEKSRGNEAPPENIKWKGKDISPAGYAGRVTVEFTAEDWKATVTFPSDPRRKQENIMLKSLIRKLTDAGS
jgi:hypothetical protein